MSSSDGRGRGSKVIVTQRQIESAKDPGTESGRSMVRCVVASAHVQRMLEAIQSDYSNALTLQRLSVTIGRQPAYLGRLFRQEV